VHVAQTSNAEQVAHFIWHTQLASTLLSKYPVIHTQVAAFYANTTRLLAELASRPKHLVQVPTVAGAQVPHG
jgi:hypothetical protein